MNIKSLAFNNGEEIPRKFTCDGVNISPSLIFTEIPSEAKSLVLIVDDPDSPTGVWNHWAVWNIPPDANVISEGKIPKGAIEGRTTFGDIGYGGPCPGRGRHRYFFKLYALDRKLSLAGGSTKEKVMDAMNGHILAEAELFGTYERKK